MGALSGSISYSKFFVRGKPPRPFQQPFMKGIRLRTFTPLEVDDEEDQRVGWCAPGNALDLDLTQSKVIQNQYVVLGFRVDKWRIPRPLFRAHFAEAEAQLLERQGKGRLSKKDKDELTFRIQRRLRKKVLPSTRAFDVCWDVDQGALRFWNRSMRVQDEFATLFEQTFSLSVDVVSPYVAAAELLDDKSLARFRQIEPTSFLDVEKTAALSLGGAKP